jgi:hypothetical protein
MTNPTIVPVVVVLVQVSVANMEIRAGTID